MAPFDLDASPFRVHGLAGAPQKAQNRSNRMFLYVNGRPVQDRVLLRAAQDAYKGRLLAREYPQLVLFLELPPELVDVNVHPAKTEVRFREESAIFSSVRRAVQEAVGRFELPVFDTPHKGTESYGGFHARPSAWSSTQYPQHNNVNAVHEVSSPSSFGSRSMGQTGQTNAGRPSLDDVLNTPYPGHERSPQMQHLNLGPGRGASSVPEGRPDEPPHPAEVMPPVFPENASCPPLGALEGIPQVTPEGVPLHVQDAHHPKSTSGVTYMGRLADSYLVLKLGEGTLALLDQHAAHERILYDRLAHGTRTETQLLALPLELPLHPAEAEKLREIWKELEGLGFSLEADADSLRVRGVPPQLDMAQAREYLRAALSEQSGGMEDLWKLMACKAAVKAGQALADDEVLHLLEEWRGCEDRHYCPHGRPVLLSWEIKDLERLFKRRN